MAWTDITRREHHRDSARYPSDLMDREWALIAPLLPPAASGAGDAHNLPSRGV